MVSDYAAKEPNAGGFRVVVVEGDLKGEFPDKKLSYFASAEGSPSVESRKGNPTRSCVRLIKQDPGW